MALTGEYSAIVLRSAIGVITSLTDPINEWQLGQRLQRLNKGTRDHTLSEYQGIARQALRITAAGSDVLFRSDGAVPASELPVDPSIGRGEERVRYRASVHITDAMGRTVRTLAVINSDEAMAYAQIRALIESDLEGTSSQRRSVRESIRQLHDLDTVEIVIISAGRRK